MSHVGRSWLARDGVDRMLVRTAGSDKAALLEHVLRPPVVRIEVGHNALEPEIVEAVGGRMPILIDSGFRRGSDIVKALALGAKAVGIGRPT